MLTSLLYFKFYFSMDNIRELLQSVESGSILIYHLVSQDHKAKLILFFTDRDPGLLMR